MQVGAIPLTISVGNRNSSLVVPVQREAQARVRAVQLVGADHEDLHARDHRNRLGLAARNGTACLWQACSDRCQGTAPTNDASRRKQVNDDVQVQVI